MDKQLYRVKNISDADAFYDRRKEILGKYFYGTYNPKEGAADGRVLGFDGDKMIFFYKVKLTKVRNVWPRSA
jgi:hypothetical protein